MASINTAKAIFQAGQTISVYAWPGDFRRRIGEPRPAAIATAAAAADGSLSVSHASIVVGAGGWANPYLCEGPKWPAGGGTQQVVSTAN